MGRPKTPTVLKVVKGTQRKDRANPSEPKPKAATKDEAPPDWLSLAATPWWHRVRPLLLQMKVLTQADPVALGLLCDALAEYVAARDAVVAGGPTYEVESKFGLTIRPRPEVAMAQDAWRRAKLMLTEFGLTPASRAKVSAEDVGPADPLAQWEQGRSG